MQAYFVTATGTDIGKTYVTAGILRADRRFRAIKPIMSGYDARYAANSDAGVLLAAMGKAVTAENIGEIAPWRFAAALSPDMAAAREGRVLDLAAVTAFCEAAMAVSVGPMLIEGVGGVLVPLNAKATVCDWLAALKIPAILAAGTYLGTISHTLAAAEALLRRDIAIAAIVLNESPGAPVTPEETAGAIGRFLPEMRLHIMPRDAGAEPFRELAALLA